VPPVEVGFFGKLPSHGDFLRRRVSDAFVDAWDAWLQSCLAASRSALGERWLDVYLTSPAWRFVCAAGTCGPAPLLGLMAPSVDSVGRYFPLTIVAELPDAVTLVSAMVRTATFFERAERLVIEMLEAEYVDFESFDAEVIGLREELDVVGLVPRVVLGERAAAILNDGADAPWQLPIGAPEQVSAALEQILSQRLALVYEPLALWWTDGSSMVEPTCLIVRGLPPADAFGALLNGSWEDHRWRSVPARVDGSAAAFGSLDAEVGTHLQSAAASDVGHARDVNEDAFVERAEAGLWAVADGLGGHRDGQLASRMVCDALVDCVPGATLDAACHTVVERIQQVNQHLVRTASGSILGRSGSTVVALVVRGMRCAVLWAGDSRAYRWRAGRLEQLTRDHCFPETNRQTNEVESHAITRAVGIEPVLTLETVRDEVRAGDRFLLCSDGLTRVVGADAIQLWLEAEDIRGAVEGLIGAALEAGAPDNVTVVMVEAVADPRGNG
jgi:type VI secretion system protein ImpM